MADSVQGKQTKSGLDDMDEIFQNKLAQLDSEDGVNDIASSLDLSLEEPKTGKTSELLDDFLMRDAQVLAGSSTVTSDIDNSNEPSEGSEKQQFETSLDAIVEDRSTSRCFKEGEQESHKFVDVGPELIRSDDEQQDSYMDSALSAQGERISQLESELSDLKKMSFIALAVAILALITGLWLGTLKPGTQPESGKQQSAIIDDDSIVPVIDQNNQKTGDLTSETKALEAEIKSPEETLILPNDDISGLNATDEVTKLKKGVEVPVNKKELVKPPVNRWVVNLYSYEQRWEMNEKMEELKKKGIPTEMIVVKVGGRRWFRIRATGFKTKVEAESYATKIKKTLNNGLAWVSKR